MLEVFVTIIDTKIHCKNIHEQVHMFFTKNYTLHHIKIAVIKYNTPPKVVFDTPIL